MSDEQKMPATLATIGCNALVLDQQYMNSVLTFADMMAGSDVTIPKHLQKKKGDCAAVVMQALRWGMDPYVVASKTHISQSGQLGYEAQLVSAVATATGAIKGQPDYEFFGDWSKIMGKVKEMESDKPDGHGGTKKSKWYAPGWNKVDEIGLGVRIIATLAGEQQPRTMDVLLTQCYPRFSTQWATDPQQQICYAGIRKFVRRHSPGALLGVYTIDELEGEVESVTVEPLRASERSQEQQPTPTQKPDYPQDRLNAQRAKWLKAIQAGERTSTDIIEMLQQRWTLSVAQLYEIKAFDKDAPTIIDPPAAEGQQSDPQGEAA
jgi:hypothetical protein